MAENNLRVNIVGNASSLNKALNTASSRLKSFGSNISSIGATLTTRLTLPLALAGGGAIKLASDFQESLNKVNVAFGSSSGEVQDFAKTALTQFGIARGSALDMAATFGDMSTSMGLSRKDAALLSTDLVGLAGDLASFKNINIEEVTRALSGVFTGETESLKRLGIVMTEVNLKNFAMEQGIKKNIKEMTQAEKVALRFQYVLSVTGNAQGDFARTGGGAANQMRIFSESLKDLGANFGELILPLFTKIITKVNSLIQAFSNLSPEMKTLAIGIAAIAASAGPVTFLFGKLLTLFGALSSPIGLVVVALTAIATVIAVNFNEILPVLVNLYNRFVDLYNGSVTLRLAIAGLKSVFATVFIGIKTQVMSTVNVFKTFGRLVGEVIEKGFKADLGSVIKEGFENGKKIVKDGAEEIKNTFVDNFSEALGSQLEHKTVEQVQTGISNVVNKAKGFLSNMALDFGGLLTGGTTGLGDNPLGEDDNIGSGLVSNLLFTKENVDALIEQMMIKFNKLKETAIMVGESAASAFGKMGADFVDSLGLADRGFEGFVKNLAGTITKLISMLLANSIANAIAGATSSGTATGPAAIFTTPAFIATAVGGVMAAFAAIPKFAMGGLVTGPTLGLVGEGIGTNRGNPEVIAPLDRLQNMIQPKTQKVEVGGQFSINGQDLVLVLQRANSDRSRLL